MNRLSLLLCLFLALPALATVTEPAVNVYPKVCAGDGHTTGFTFAFPIGAAADLKIVVRSAAGIETTKTITTHYTVTVANNRYPAPAGGTVTMATAPASGETLTIGTNIPLDQGTSLTYGNWTPTTVMQSLDKLTRILWEMQRELQRCVKIPLTDDLTDDTELPVSGTAGYVYRTAAGDFTQVADANVGGGGGALTASLLEYSTMPVAGTDPDVDAVGEIGRDTNDDALRGFSDGLMAQFVYGQAVKSFHVTIFDPCSAPATSVFPIWNNVFSQNFHLLTFRSQCSDQVGNNLHYTLYEASPSDYETLTQIAAVVVSTDGASVDYKTTNTAGMDHTVVDAGKIILMKCEPDHDADFLSVTITGYFNANVN